MKHHTLHKNHLEKDILEAMIISCTQITTLHKIKAHTNINGNEQANAIAKHGTELNQRDAATQFEQAHPTPYYFVSPN